MTHAPPVFQELVRKTAGAELCATPANQNPKPIDCARAFDETYKGRVDLSDKVRIGEPVQKSALHWAVPYDVTDEAGNAASTVWRDIIVEEVDLASFQRDADVDAIVKKALSEKEKEHQTEMRKQVAKAVEEERQKKAKSCPDCPKCDCAPGQIDASKCDSYCKNQAQTCDSTHYQESWIVHIMVWLEEYVPWQIVPFLVTSVFLIFVLTLLRWIISFLFTPSSRPRTYIASDERERQLQSAASILRSPTNGSTTNGDSYHQHQPPQVSFFSPGFGSPPMDGRGPDVPRSSGYDDIYASQPLITPRRRQTPGFQR